MDKETKVILGWFGIEPEQIPDKLNSFYSSPKFWIAIIIIFFLLGLIIAVS